MVTKLSSPRDLQTLFPLSKRGKASLLANREVAKNIFLGKDERKVCIIGPCSIHHIGGFLTYTELFQDLANRVSDTLFLVLRAYIEKPRTLTGWKGFMLDPLLTGSTDIELGLHLSRELLLSLVEKGIPLATEFVNPLSSYYFSDLITWGFIGARTAVSQPHREIASSFPFPVGFKNTIDGDINAPIDSILASRAPHTFLGISPLGQITSIESTGNPYTHLVLRGSEQEPNYDAPALAKALHRQRQRGISSPLLIDCAHGNSKKCHHTQELVFQKVLHHLPPFASSLLGFMLESYLEGGHQPSLPSPYLSFTDPCISWERTESLILEAHHLLLDQSLALR